jgi:hypothetical protein
MAKAISWEQDDYKIVVMSVDPNRLPKLKNGSDATSMCFDMDDSVNGYA